MASLYAKIIRCAAKIQAEWKTWPPTSKLIEAGRGATGLLPSRLEAEEWPFLRVA